MSDDASVTVRRGLPSARVPRELYAALALSIAYYFGVKVGAALTFPPYPVSTLWPPNAILLATLLLVPRRSWPLCIAAVLPAHFAAQLGGGVPPLMSALWYVSNVAEAALGAGALQRILGSAPRFDRVRDVAVFLALAVFLVPLLTTFIDAGFVALVGWQYGGEFWEICRMRFFSNALAASTLVPPIVVSLHPNRPSTGRADFGRRAELALLLVGLGIVSSVAFHRSHSHALSAVVLYAPLPFLIWAAIRHGVRGVSLGTALVAAFAITGVMREDGPFVGPEGEAEIFSLQVFLLLVEVSLMLLAASRVELHHARRIGARHEESLKLALEAAEMETWEWDASLDRISWGCALAPTGGADGESAPESMAAFLQRVHRDDRPAVKRAIDEGLRSGSMGEIEYRFLVGGGDYRWITSRGRAIADTKGAPFRMIGVRMDRTERKLDEMVTRTQQEQLMRLSRIATLGELSGAIAHELNQPLTAIIVNAEAAQLMIEAPDLYRKEMIETLADILSEGKRAGEVIQRLRVLFTRGTVQEQRVDMNECVKAVLALEHSDLVRRSVATEVRLAAHPLEVVADPVQLQQVILNLIVNACDAMDGNAAGDRRLSVGSAADGSRAHIVIGDNGEGIEDVGKIFRPFYSTKDHGIGLGLALCRRIVAAHGGDLWATNNVTRGAALHIALPLKGPRSEIQDGEEGDRSCMSVSRRRS